MRKYRITEQYMSTITYIVEAEDEDDARQQVETGLEGEGHDEGAFETDFDSGEIVSIEDITEEG